MPQIPLEEIIKELQSQPIENWEKLLPIYNLQKSAFPVTHSFKTHINNNEYLIENTYDFLENEFILIFTIKENNSLIAEDRYSLSSNKNKETSLEQLFNNIKQKFSEHYKAKAELEWQKYEKEEEIKSQQKKEAEKSLQETKTTTNT